MELGRKFCEAAAALLEQRGHAPGVLLKIDGDFRRSYAMVWSRRKRSSDDAAKHPLEWAAYGIAIVLARVELGKVVVDMADGPAGLEFWLDDESNDEGFCFDGMTTLNVSGILEGGEAAIASLTSGIPSASTDASTPKMTVYVAIVEFGAPMTRMVTQ